MSDLKLSRREWLHTALALPVVACSASSPRPATRAGVTRGRVLVVGAGIAGLTTAYRLLGHGFDVVVLEAQSRVGGRALTVREPFRDGAYVDVGPKHVLADGEFGRLLSELGVARYTPGRAPRAPRVVFRGGQRSVVPVGTEPPPIGDGLSAEERALGMLDRWSHYFGPNDTGQPWTPGWITPERAPFDRMSLEAYLAERHASPAFVRDVAESIGMGESPAQLSTMFIMEQIAAFRHEMTLPAGDGRITGGTDAIPRTLAQRLGDRVHLGAVVRRIATTTDGVRVQVQRNGALDEITGDRVVMAVHGPVVRRITFEPALDADVHEALDRLRVVSVARGWVQLDERVWASAGVAGGADTDELLGTVREDADLQPRPWGILTFYLSGDHARTFGGLSTDERRGRFLDLVERAHPGASGHVVATEIKAWDEDPWAQGAHAWMPTEYMTRWQPVLMRPHGRVHFAGDYASYRPGFMHGAVQAAMRVVEEVLGARGSG